MLGIEFACAVAPATVPCPRAFRFLLVRHGETNYNADGRVQGTLESRLTPRGREQAATLGRWLADHEPALRRVAVSPKQRTRETLETILTEHPAQRRNTTGTLDIDVRPGLREIELTAWEGRLRQDITAGPLASSDMPDADGARWNRWKADPMTFAFEEDGHAPFQCLWERAGVEWKSLQDHAIAVSARQAASYESERIEEEPTLVVAHGAFNRALLLQSLGLPPAGWRDDQEHFHFDNCECVELEWRAPSTQASRWRRRYPRESDWRTCEDEARRAADTYLASGE